MHKFSVKFKITLYLTVLTVVLSITMFMFMLAVSRSAAKTTAMEQLVATVRGNIGSVELNDGNLTIGSDFLFSSNGVSTLVYSSSESLLAGQLPVAFTASEPFQNGLIRTVACGDTEFLVLDIWVEDGWENGVWVRGLIEMSTAQQISASLLRVAALTIPVFSLFAAAGGYIIIRRSFRPLDKINSTAAAINEAKDLSLRIGLPEGKDEFSQLAQTFDQLFERLERAFESEKQFTADASHELRTPVSIIKGACEYARKYDETPEERQETIEMIERQALKMSELISQLLSMTRLDQGVESAASERVELGTLVSDTLDGQDFDASRLTVDAQDGAWVIGDSSLLTVLLKNLVTNAFKYGKPDGHVWVTVSTKDREVLLSVRDDGIGISPEQQEKVWQRFYQVEPSRSGVNGGVGLGLAMVRQIAELHGGYMTLESVPELGSVFTLHLPAATQPQTAEKSRKTDA